jgi:hypothetical protein
MHHLNVSSVEEVLRQRFYEEHIYIGDEREQEAAMMITKQSNTGMCIVACGLSHVAPHQSGPTVFHRALHGFVLLKDDKPGAIIPFAQGKDSWKYVTVIGYAASLSGDAGLCAQTGQWFEGSVKPQLLSIRGIKSMDLVSDPSYRNG